MSRLDDRIDILLADLYDEGYKCGGLGLVEITNKYVEVFGREAFEKLAAKWNWDSDASDE